jgi:hypothetical protein
MRALAVAIAVVACSRAAPVAPSTRGPIPIAGSAWLPGEKLWFQVSTFGVHVADLVAAVGTPGPYEGRTAIVLKSRASTSGAVKALLEGSEETTVWLDAETGTPLAREDVFDNGPERGTQRWGATYHTGHVRHRDLDGGSPWDQTTPSGPIYDNLSIVGLLRGWIATPGAIGEFYAVTDRLLHFHVARYAGTEFVPVLGTSRRVRRYDVDVFEATATAVGKQRPDQSYSMWFTDDAARVPVQITAPHRIGRMIYKLSDYQPE